MDVYFKLKAIPYLKTANSNGVRLIATDKNGEILPSGNILEIKSDGTLKLYPGVSMLLGLKLDSTRRIKLQA
jgi:hypothetical protein